jgi:hypothetical protein
VFSRSFYIYLLDPSNSFQEKKALVGSLASLGPAAPCGVPISALYGFFNSCPEISPQFTAVGNTLATTTTRATALQSPPADDPYARYLYGRVSHVQVCLTSPPALLLSTIPLSHCVMCVVLCAERTAEARALPATAQVDDHGYLHD